MIQIFIENNISQALEFLNGKSEYRCFYVSDPFALGCRRKVLEENYNYLQLKIPKIQCIEKSKIELSSQNQCWVFAWNAYDEKKRYKGARFGDQNRLFRIFDLSKVTSFTPFRKVAEKLLPKYFDDQCEQFPDAEVAESLEYYFEKTHLAKRYFEIRNGVLGRDYSTKFSKYLASGRLNVRYLYNYIKDFEKKFGSNKSTYWLVYEILWREFFYWSYQKHQQKYFSLNGLSGPKDFKRNFTEATFHDDPFMSSVINELKTTGFISNRFRQVFASAFIHRYQQDWRGGAELFERYLVDYDVFSNWGNWQYLAGVGHDPRGGRSFNVIKQLNTYDPEYRYIKKWNNEMKLSDAVAKIHQIYKN